MISFCANCGVGLALPELNSSDLDGYYENGEYWKESRLELIRPYRFPFQFSIARIRWDFLKRFLPAGLCSVLDIGAGLGFLGMAAAERGGISKYTCIEKDPYIKKALDHTWSLKFRNTPLQFADDISAIDDTFDCIVLSHVVEHVYDPKGIIEQAARKLNDNGIIFIDVPHQDYKFKQDVFPHVLFFTPENLKLLLGYAVTVLSAQCFGNSIENSPMNPRIAGLPASALNKLITKFSFAIPNGLLAGYFSRIFMMAEKNDNGIWIRAIGKKIPIA